eukprot:TRINITY_DN21_c0_g1_i2.p1 TRINITY_DN21_c0_g1~~TRINITY_DN21_c0_g1_i2.p1  ORF type:complete len:420 (-),score=41.66 TRINITY_DN21_c0_g1_i2:65-1324(-)
MMKNRHYVILFLALMMATYIHAKNTLLPNESWTSGYIPLDPFEEETGLFYLLIHSKPMNNSAPLVIWLNGGPGASSMVGAFQENGPFVLNLQRPNFTYNPYSWNTFADMLYVDQPVSVGFSISKTESRICMNETCVASDFYAFLIKFMERYPQYIGRDLYLTGESYAGHYLPAIAAHLVKANNKWLNLKGMAIGNPFVKNKEQAGLSPGYLLENGVISYIKYLLARVGALVCQVAEYVDMDSKIVYDLCWDATFAVIHLPNEYDIRANESYDRIDKILEERLNEKEVQEELGVNGIKFALSNDLVGTLFEADTILSLGPELAYVLDKGLDTMIYFGDQDYSCNYRSGEYMLNGVVWEGKEQFNKAEYKPWEGGRYRRYKNLNLVIVHDSGHLVPMDQPILSLDLIKLFIYHWDQCYFDY